jgi:hypothetical protein
MRPLERLQGRTHHRQKRDDRIQRGRNVIVDKHSLLALRALLVLVVFGLVAKVHVAQHDIIVLAVRHGSGAAVEQVLFLLLKLRRGCDSEHEIRQTENENRGSGKRSASASRRQEERLGSRMQNEEEVWAGQRDDE